MSPSNSQGGSTQKEKYSTDSSQGDNKNKSSSSTPPIIPNPIQNKKMERAKGVEPSTSTLARLRSTTELRPHAPYVPDIQQKVKIPLAFLTPSPRLLLVLDTRHDLFSPPSPRCPRALREIPYTTRSLHRRRQYQLLPKARRNHRPTRRIRIRKNNRRSSHLLPPTPKTLHPLRLHLPKYTQPLLPHPPTQYTPRQKFHTPTSQTYHRRHLPRTHPLPQSPTLHQKTTLRSPHHLRSAHHISTLQPRYPTTPRTSPTLRTRFTPR